MTIKIITLISIIILLTSCADEKPTTLDIGDTAPDIVLNDQDGNIWKLSDHLDREFLVVYFYPAAMTGGCTKQACSYRDYKNKLDDLQVNLVGISGDPVKNLKIFQQAHQLNFPLLSDITGEIARKFGIPVTSGGSISRTFREKDVILDRSYTIARWTFILNNHGKILYKDSEVDVENDSKKVMDFIKNYQN